MESFSEHFKKDHFLQRIDARVKMAVVFSLLVMVLSYKGLLFPLIIAAVSLMLCMHMRVPARVMLLRYSQPMFLAAIVLLLKLFFSGEETIFTLGIWGYELSGHMDGLIEGLKITSRIAGAVSLVILLGFATPFVEFMAGLSWMKVPKQFIEIMMFAYRYVFMLLEDAMTIYSAQKNRLGYAGIKKGLNSFGVLTGSLVLRGFEQSQKISEAMVQRGYTGDMPVIDKEPVRAGHMAMALIVVVLGGIVWMI